ncbi:hypothetical protein WJX84_003771 [Apatococcus fuscideae]|uniref:Protein kinase domain-containing protein n=1 Tax=Apatococcus fuscideae TaxID=2026836 RepID=A0AAW1TGP7_9CHLO
MPALCAAICPEARQIVVSLGCEIRNFSALLLTEKLQEGYLRTLSCTPAASPENVYLKLIAAEPLCNFRLYSVSASKAGLRQLALDLQTNSQVAIKFIERGGGVSKSVLREILNHRLCVVHPNIVQFREVFLSPQHLAIVMEFAGGGDMFELQQMFPRIVNAEFQAPWHVSQECLHLLHAMLTADPSKRIKVAQIMQHPCKLPAQRTPGPCGTTPSNKLVQDKAATEQGPALLQALSSPAAADNNPTPTLMRLAQPPPPLLQPPLPMPYNNQAPDNPILPSRHIPNPTGDVKQE